MQSKTLFAILLLLYLSACNKKEPIAPPSPCDSKCALEPEQGPCLALFSKYYFDKTEKKCKPFVWGGCDGVVPFETLAECEACGCE